MRLLQLTWLLPIVLAYAGSALAELTRLSEWKFVDYVWESDEAKAAAIESGQYNASRILIKDVQPLEDRRVLVTTPKIWDNPGSLSVISDETGDGGPLLKPYPSWEWHKKAGDCSGITNAGRAKLDKCNRLWVVDSGKIGSTRYCPAKVLIFDPTSDELLDQIEIPEDLTHNPNDSSKGNPEVQTIDTKGDDCAETWVFIADPIGGGLIILDYPKSDFWRLNNEIFASKSDEAVFTVNNENVTMNIGLSSMIILPPGFLEEESVLFKPMSSNSAYGANRKELRESCSRGNVTYYKSNYTAPGPELERDISREGIIVAGFNGLLACWNIQYPLEDPNVVVLQQDAEVLAFTTGVRIFDGIQNGVEGQNVWAISSRMNKFVKGTLDLTEVNIYLLGGNLDELVTGTYCEPASYEIVHSLPEKDFPLYEISNE